MLESNYLTMLMKPTYEKPVDSQEDIIDMGLNVIYPPGFESTVKEILNDPSSSDKARKIAERVIVPKVIFFLNYLFNIKIL